MEEHIANLRALFGQRMLDREEQARNQAAVNNDREGLMFKFLSEAIRRLEQVVRERLQPEIDAMFDIENGVVHRRLNGNQGVTEDEVREIIEDSVRILRDLHFEREGLIVDENIANLIGNFLMSFAQTLNNPQFSERVERLIHEVFGNPFDEETPISSTAIERIFRLIIETLSRNQQNN